MSFITTPSPIAPAQRDILRAIRFGGAQPDPARVEPLIEVGLVLRTRVGRLALTAEGYRASNVMPVTAPARDADARPREPLQVVASGDGRLIAMGGPILTTLNLAAQAVAAARVDLAAVRS